LPGMIFIQNNQPNLATFNTDKFDLIISLITLQHIPDKKIIKEFILEFLRILKPNGILYFQLPSVASFSPIKNVLLKLRGKLYYFLIKLGVSKENCFKKKIMPFMSMNYLSRKEVEIILNEAADILQTYDDNTVNQRYLVRKCK